LHKRKPIIAIDFDGTIVENNGYEMGLVKKDAVRIIQWIHSWADIIIWTCRGGKDLEEARLELVFRVIPFDAINENVHPAGFNPKPKIFYDVLIDDKMLGGLPSWKETETILQEFKERWYGE
jgi:hypothetical protein